MNRRQFLKTFGASALAVGPLAHTLSSLPERMLAPAPSAGALAFHAIKRMTFGMTPALYTHVRTIGPSNFAEEQLAPETLDDSALEQLLATYKDVLDENGGILLKKYARLRAVVTSALVNDYTVRALFSQRQLHEVLVQFFSNHFYEYVRKDPVLFFKAADDRTVIRPHALGTFRHLLGASAHSPAMLLFLDNAESTKHKPNENYARELMELHTLGVNGGYTEADVKEVARCLTGWSVDRLGETTDGTMNYRFRSTLHDNEGKTVLGVKIPARGGEEDGEMVLDLLAMHRSTAHFISTKLARRFVSDNPPEALVERLAATYQQSGGDIPSLLRLLFSTDEFWNAPPKLKQPFEYVMSLLRALNFEITNTRSFLVTLTDALSALGQVPFSWTTPDGFPDRADYWTIGLLQRWNIALAAATDQFTGARMNFDSILQLMEADQVGMNFDEMMAFMANYLLGRPLTSDEMTVITEFARSSANDLQTQVAAGTALLLASPAFQYR